MADLAIDKGIFEKTWKKRCFQSVKVGVRCFLGKNCRTPIVECPVEFVNRSFTFSIAKSRPFILNQKNMNKFAALLCICCLVNLNIIYGQVISDSILIDGHYRTFHFKTSQPLTKGSSLVFVLHGSGFHGKGMMEATTKLAEKADAENFLLVYPDGYKKYWNECRKAASSLANKENIDEESFFQWNDLLLQKEIQD